MEQAENDSDNDEHLKDRAISAIQEKRKFRCKFHTFIIGTLCFALLGFFAEEIVHHKILLHDIGSWYYGSAEALCNLMVVLLSVWIYWKYIKRRIGTFKRLDCTKFDFYAIVSLLWLLTVTLLYVVYSHWGYFFANLIHGIAIIAPGIVHKFYIRFQLSSRVTYLGDMWLYKSVIILFYAIQILSNTVTVSLNEDWFKDTNSEIFNISAADTNNYHLTWILAGLLGRPFLSILLFHGLILYFNWILHEDKANSYHSMDLLLSWTSNDSQYNCIIGFSVMSLFITELILGDKLIYNSIFFAAYTMLAVVLFICMLIDTISFSKAPQAHGEMTKIDMFEVCESLFTLVTGLIANFCYIFAVGGKEITAVLDLLAFSILMVAQFTFIMYFQMYPHHINLKVLQCSAFASAVSIMYLFLFEYEHFLHLLTDSHSHDDESHYSSAEYHTTAAPDSHIDDHHRRMASTNEYDAELTTDLKIISYSLFWCLMEFYIWSFVTANHMMHHNHHSNNEHGDSSNKDDGPDLLFVKSILRDDEGDFQVNTLVMSQHATKSADNNLIKTEQTQQSRFNDMHTKVCEHFHS